MDRGLPGEQESGGLVEGQVRGLLEHLVRGGDDLVGIATDLPGGDDVITGLEPVDTRADGGDSSGDLEAETHGDCGRVGAEGSRIQLPVDGINAGGFDVDEHVSVCGAIDRHLAELEYVGCAVGGGDNCMCGGHTAIKVASPCQYS